VMRAAAQSGLKVMLDGQGGDEVLAGYQSTTRAYRYADLLAHLRLRELTREIRAFDESPAALAQSLVTPFLPQQARWWLRARRDRSDLLVNQSLTRGRLPRDEANGRFPDRLRAQYHRILTRYGLPELLRYEDRNTMAHSLEGRVPFLDHRLVELAYGLPGSELVGGGETKLVLRRALADLLPPEVRNRRDKLGFVTPEQRFMRGELGAFARRILNQEKTRSRGFVNADEVLRRLERGAVGGSSVWRTVSVELWARAHLD
jgi:asparagine synthase (glutamine-hydrolysing)